MPWTYGSDATGLVGRIGRAGQDAPVSPYTSGHRHFGWFQPTDTWGVTADTTGLGSTLQKARIYPPDFDRIYVGLGYSGSPAVRTRSVAAMTGVTLTKITDVDTGATSALTVAASNHPDYGILTITGGCLQLPAGFTVDALRKYPYANIGWSSPAGWLPSEWLSYYSITARARTLTNPWKYARTSNKATAPVLLAATNMVEDLPLTSDLGGTEYSSVSSLYIGDSDLLLWFDQPVTPADIRPFTAPSTMSAYGGGSVTNRWACDVATRATRHPLFSNCLVVPMVTGIRYWGRYIVPAIDVAAGVAVNASGQASAGTTGTPIERLDGMRVMFSGFGNNAVPPSFDLTTYRDQPGGQGSARLYSAAATQPGDAAERVWTYLYPYSSSDVSPTAYPSAETWTDQASWKQGVSTLLSGANHPSRPDRMTCVDGVYVELTTGTLADMTHTYDSGGPVTQTIASGVFPLYLTDRASGQEIWDTDSRNNVLSYFYHVPSRRLIPYIAFRNSNFDVSGFAQAARTTNASWTDACSAAPWTNMQDLIPCPNVGREQIAYASASAPAVVTATDSRVGSYVLPDMNLKAYWEVRHPDGVTVYDLSDFGIGSGERVIMPMRTDRMAVVGTTTGLWRVQAYARYARTRYYCGYSDRLTRPAASLGFSGSWNAHALEGGTGGDRLINTMHAASILARGGTFYPALQARICRDSSLSDPYTVTLTATLSVYRVDAKTYTAGTYTSSCTTSTYTRHTIDFDAPAGTLVGSTTLTMSPFPFWDTSSVPEWTQNTFWPAGTYVQYNWHAYYAAADILATATTPDLDPQWTLDDTPMPGGSSVMADVYWLISEADAAIAIGTDAPAGTDEYRYVMLVKFNQPAVLVDALAGSTFNDRSTIDAGCYLLHRDIPMPYGVGSLDSGSTHYPGRIPPGEAARIGL